MTNTFPLRPVTVAAISAWSPLEAGALWVPPTLSAIPVLTVSGKAVQSLRMVQLLTPPSPRTRRVIPGGAAATDTGAMAARARRGIEVSRTP